MISEHFKLFLNWSFWDIQPSLTSPIPPSTKKRTRPAQKFKVIYFTFSIYLHTRWVRQNLETPWSPLEDRRAILNRPRSKYQWAPLVWAFHHNLCRMSSVQINEIYLKTLNTKQHLNASRRASPFGWESFLSSVAIIFKNSLNSIEQFFSSELNPLTSSATSLPEQK